MLRDYQHTAINSILSAWQHDSRVLCTMPTGTGKTIVFLSLIDKVLKENKEARVLVIVDQIILADQTLERIQQFYPHLAETTSIMQGKRGAGDNDRLIIALWQTYLKRPPIEGVTHIIIDEAHCYIDAQLAIINLHARSLVVGLTATPRRADERSLAEIYAKKIAYQMLLPDAIRDGHLVPFSVYEAYLPISLDGIRRVGDSWDSEKLGNLLCAENVKEIVLSHWKKWLDNRLTIAYTAYVRDAAEFADYFTRHGVSSAYVHGGSSNAEKTDVLGGMRDGKYKVVFNCQMLIKGFDCPQASATMMIKPVRSDTTVMQMLGRILRLHPDSGKKDAIALSFGVLGEADIVMAGDLVDAKLRRAIKSASSGECETGIQLRADGSRVVVDENRVRVRQKQLLGKSSLAWFFRGRDMVHWTATINKSWSLCIVLPDQDRIDAAEKLAMTDNWCDEYENLADFLSTYRLYKVNRNAVYLGSYADFETCKKAADEVAKQTGVDPSLAKKQRGWRSLPVTRGYRDESGRYKWGQTDLLKNYKVDLSEAKNRGEAAQLITHAKTVKAVKDADGIKSKEAMKKGVYDDFIK